jgi:signal transduction histidine kinase/CheY-like chemotaxis protein
VPTGDLIEALPVATLVIDRDGRVVWANATAASLLGPDPAELPGLDLVAVVPGAPLVADGTGAPAHAGALVAYRRDGRAIPVDIAIRELGDDAGRRVVVLHDVSARVAHDAAEAEAERLEALRRLAGSIGPDMNNLLTAINGYADLIALELPPGSPIANEVGEIRAAGLRGAELIRRLMVFARRHPLHPRTVELAPFAATIEPKLRQLTGDRIDLVVDVDPVSPPIVVDAAWLEDSIVNLVTNAIEAISDRGTVRINAGSRGLEPGLVAIVVADSGPGIDEAITPHVFIPFFTTKPPAVGNGLGLASVHGFVVQSGGRIEIGRGPDGGASIRLELPVATADEPSVPETSGATAGELVLVVEDNDSVRALARISLERQGYRVVEAGAPRDVDAALATAAGSPVAVVTDMRMPGMDGRSMARDLRRRYPGIGVVIVSGYLADGIGGLGSGTFDDPLHGLEGAIPLAKPFDPGGLVAAVREAIDRAPG